ncbi:TIGR04024 family LLM class F420-dependent oxidoreductase [Haloglomus irregulare]|uniref:TIGR04024 family LLM class F420-dependent oxidoreductase n=1 Tax=Haloglomus irregulare TaxID=2234134 RepID=A0A554N9M9_9EURY|nr:TIGR04024 family LLM class F420-dependent oxidoreductase [Haloglomus irregulare]TSD14059.1 TIGR04024 family LLM class F420-dependent oxidoreductase [Haloglomus irregulare]
MAFDVALDGVLMLSDHSTIDDAVAQARRYEDCGFARVSMGEVTGWNVVPVLTAIARETEDIGISNDVFAPPARSPAMLAQTALTLHEASDGRYRLGLGPSSPALVERWHSGEFDPALRRTRETIDVVRAVYEGGKVEYHGEVFDMGGMSYDRQVPDDPPAIDLATLGPTAVEMTGRFADGWVPQLFTADGLRDRLGDLERGAEMGDRAVDDVRVAPIVRTFAHEDGDHARSMARQMVAFLIGAYGPFYGNSVADQGYPDAVEEIRAAWEEKDTAAMAAALPDEALEAFAAAGTPEEVREHYREIAAVEGVDAVRCGFVAGMSQDDKEGTMAALSEL